MVLASCGPTPPRAVVPPRPLEPVPWPPPSVPGRVEPERLEPERAPEGAEWQGPAPWLVRVDAERPEDRLAVFWNPRCAEGDGQGWSFGVGSDAVAWETLECVDAMAVVDLDGDGGIDVAAAAWEDSCPDPVAPEGGGPPCLLLSVWPDADGIPQTYRMEGSAGRMAATGRESLDRLAAMLAASPCPALDLRGWSSRREIGLVRRGAEGELLEGLRCMPHPVAGRTAPTPALATIDWGDAERLPDVDFVMLADADAGEAERWSDGWELLDDLDLDGVREWLWIRRTADGDRMTVTRGADRGRTLAGFATDAAGNLLDRRVVAPPGGRARLDGWTFEAISASGPARVLLDVAIEPASGEPSRVRLDLPLAGD